ncbi:unnamed protein product [Chrysoparadoxa australica]
MEMQGFCSLVPLYLTFLSNRAYRRTAYFSSTRTQTTVHHKSPLFFTSEPLGAALGQHPLIKAHCYQTPTLGVPQVSVRHCTCYCRRSSLALFFKELQRGDLQACTKPFQQHRAFKGSQLHWSATDKEAYSVVMLFQRFQHPLWQRIHLYCDHAALVCVFHPHCAILTIARRGWNTYAKARCYLTLHPLHGWWHS